MTISGLRLFVRRLNERSILNEEEQQAILELPTHEIKVHRRQDFGKEDQETTHACLVISGLIARYGQTIDGKRQTVAIHIPGDMADLHSTVRPVAIGGLTAISDATILTIPTIALRRLAAEYPAIAEAFWRDSLLDAAVLMQWLVNVGRHNARRRLARLFCEMSIRFGGDREVLSEYPFPLSQEQLADAVGMTSVHVNRSIQLLRAERLISMTRDTVTIHDWDKLAEAGDFDASYLTAGTADNRQGRLLALV